MGRAAGGGTPSLAGYIACMQREWQPGARRLCHCTRHRRFHGRELDVQKRAQTGGKITLDSARLCVVGKLDDYGVLVVVIRIYADKKGRGLPCSLGCPIL